MRRAKKGEEQQALGEEEALFGRLEAVLDAETPLRDADSASDELYSLRSFGFLTLKPVMVLLNTGEDLRHPDGLVRYPHRHTALLCLQGQLEMEIAHSTWTKRRCS